MGANQLAGNGLRAFPRLPVELQAEIIDVHQHNFHQLRTMVHVCSGWRQRCNRHLFRQIQIKPSNAQSFMTLVSPLFSRNGIIRHICHLWIGGHDDRQGEWDAFRIELLQDLLMTFRKAHNLTDLTLLKSVSDLFEVGFITLLPLHLPHVHSLHLSDIHFSNPEEFTDFFGGFNSIQYVVLKDVTVPNPYTPLAILDGDPTRPHSNSRFILSLHFDDDGTVRRCLRWKSSQRGMRIALRDLAVLHSSSAAGPMRTGASVSVGPDVSHIEILAKQCHGHELWQFPTARIDISSALSLRYLTVGSSRCVLSLLTWVPALLAQVPASAVLKEIRIAFASSRQFDLDQPFIRYLAHTLMSGRKPFASLQTIHFMAFGTLGDKEIEGKIGKTILAEFEEKEELVRFTFSP